MQNKVRLLIYGDSISTTNFSGGGYEAELARLLGAEEVSNYAENAAALTHGYPYSVYDKITQTRDDGADYIVLWAGTNDWYYGVPLGDDDCRDPGCFCGSVRGAVLTLSQNYPRARLVFVTPIFRFSEYDGEAMKYNAYEKQNARSHTLYDYYRAVRQVSERVGFSVCDMRTLSGINLCNHAVYLRDGVHPTKAGYELISRILYRALTAG